MIHLSAWCFFIGLFIYLFHINKAVFGVFLCCSCLCFIAYCIVGHWLVKVPDRSLSSEGIDERVLNRIFRAVVAEDSHLVRFFEIVPGFCRSSVINNPRRKITNLGEETLQIAVKKLLERTWSSNFLSDSEKMRRLIICGNVADALHLPNIAWSILKDIFIRDWHSSLRSAEQGQFLKSQGNRGRQTLGLCAQSIVACIISNVQRSNGGWIALATDQLGASLPHYLKHGNESVSLANLIYITRQIVQSTVGDDLNQGMAHASTFILPTLSRFNIQNTLPELQRDFLTLWDEIDREAPNNNVFMVVRDKLRHLHDALTVDGLPRGSEVQNSSLGPPYYVQPDHTSLDHNTRSTTLIRPSSNFAPAVPPHTAAPSQMLSPQGPIHITAELADNLSPSVVRSA
ncbi:hypothetical protein BGW80DRAFT_1322369 [Lactifluus volemus]|nr:hypothetical protein BGW80DRAFT_1322369 [Lactifluus volemus]